MDFHPCAKELAAILLSLKGIVGNRWPYQALPAVNLFYEA
jgi:hypothetical protein